MALPTQYLVSIGRGPDIFAAIKNARAPSQFSQSFLETLEFKSTNDRLIIGVLKALKFLDDGGKPLQRYFDFLDQTQSGRVLAEAIKDAYSDLFAVNVNAQLMLKPEFVGKVKTLTQGQISELVLDRMWLTFSALVKEADFASGKAPAAEVRKDAVLDAAKTTELQDATHDKLPERAGVSLGGLVYNIELHLPETRDKAVYDVLFRSLREHLL